MIATAELTHAGPRVPLGQSWKNAGPAGLAARVWARARCRADQVAAHVRVPADVRAETPVEPGERILLFARDVDGGLAAGTDRALRHQAAGGWSRHGWEQLTRATWNDEAHTLIVKGTGSGHVDAIPMPAHDGARLAFQASQGWRTRAAVLDLATSRARLAAGFALLVALLGRAAALWVERVRQLVGIVRRHVADEHADSPVAAAHTLGDEIGEDLRRCQTGRHLKGSPPVAW